MKRTRKMLITLTLLSVVGLTACGSPAETNMPNHGTNAEEGKTSWYAANGDLQEITSGLEKLPSFLNDQPKILQQAYEVAALQVDLLAYIPCYCGCGSSAGHRSNKNCFIQEVKPDGKVVWDDHGTRCNVCVETALLSAKMKMEGKSDLEIRKFIDENYKSGYARPTDTEMPVS